MHNGKIVRALDVGYGNVKFVREHAEPSAKVICSMFPSRAPAASDNEVGGGALKKRDTVIVKVNGSEYEVGFDSSRAQGANDIASFHNKSYVKSDGYMALVLGALHYMFLEIEGDTIDMLVVGLPVNNIQQYKEYLIKKLKGSHTLPGNKTIDVKDVRVFAQPLGAFFNFMYSPDEGAKYNYNEVKMLKNLIIDPGMYTFDWLLIDRMQTIDKRSGANFQSMSDIIKAMAKPIAKQFNTDEAQVFRIIDDSIRESRQPRIFGEDVKLEDYFKYARAIIDSSVDALSNSVGDGVDIDNIMLVGGGAKYFHDAIKARFPRHKIITTENSVFANVIGFQMAGERVMLGEQVKERKTSLATS